MDNTKSKGKRASVIPSKDNNTSESSDDASVHSPVVLFGGLHGMWEDHLCLWFQCPPKLKAILLLNLTDGRATPVPMDCFRMCADLWTPDLRDCILEGRGRIDDSIIFEVANLCPDLSSLDVSNITNITDASIVKIAETCKQLQSLNVRGTGGKITDVGIQAVAASCHALTSLNVSGTLGKITDVGIQAVTVEFGRNGMPLPFFSI